VSRVRASIQIDRPRRAVYQFVATPRTWRLWHPGRVTVSGVVDHPPAVGESVTEKLWFGGIQARLAWQVTKRKTPERWAMAVRMPQLGDTALDFMLAANGKGTLLECEIVYDGVSVLVDRLYVRPRILAEANASLARLKQALEK